MQTHKSPVYLAGMVLFVAITFCSIALGDEKLGSESTLSEVAGRSLAKWTKDLGDENEFVRLRAVKSLGPFGSSAIEALIYSLDDDSRGVQYWAASHLGAIGKTAAPAIDRLAELQSSKESASVAMAASFALCQIDGPKKHIDLLIERLKHPERGMACSACEFLGRLGADGRAAVPALEQAFRDHNRRPGEKGKPAADYHVRGAAQNALRKIQPGWKPKS